MSAPEVTNEALSAALPPELRFVRRLGKGGQRVVFLIERGSEQLALKLMAQEERERAEREVSKGQGLDHLGLTRIQSGLLDLVVSGTSYLYFLEDFVDGESLDKITSMEVCEVLQMIEELGEAVRYLYEERNLVHRDIKPANIMRTPEGRFVLLDIGVARHQDLDTLTAFNAPHGPGTPGYLAPEQLMASKGRDLDSRADQFAIAIVAFKMLTGRFPFRPGSGSYRTLLTTGTVSNWDGVPETVKPLLARMLQPKPHRRFRQGRITAAISSTKEEAGCS